MFIPDANNDGSTCVACWLDALTYGSELMRTTFGGPGVGVGVGVDVGGGVPKGPGTPGLPPPQPATNSMQMDSIAQFAAPRNINQICPKIIQPSDLYSKSGRTSAHIVVRAKLAVAVE